MIDLANNTVVTTITGFDQPLGVAVNPAGTYAYVANVGNNNVSVIDLASNTVTGTVSVGNSPFGVAVNPSGTYAYVANHGDNTVSVISLSNGNFGSEAVGSTTASQPLYFSIGASTTVSSIGILTGGASGLDYADGGGSTCTAKTYSSTTNCVVNVKFTPKAAGTRNGAVVFYDGSTVLATAYLKGTGTGPQIAFPSNDTPFPLGGGFVYPNGVAVDGNSNGNVYVADTFHNAVKEMPQGCASSSCVSTLGGGFNLPDGVAVDGAGNVYVADTDNSAVKEMPAGCASSSCVSTLGGGFFLPTDVAVDSSGNLYVGDTDNNAVKKMPPGCASSSCVSTLGGGFSLPAGVAVDGSGNVYVADSKNSAVKEIPPGCASSSCVSTLGGGFNVPTAVAVDGAGNIYVADTSNNAVKEMPAGCASSSCVTTLGGGYGFTNGVAVDGSGNVYVGDSGNNAVKEMALSTPPSLSFAATLANTTSSDSPQTVTITNIGNATLTFPLPTTGTNPSVAVNFAWDNASTCTQTFTSSSTAYTLAANASCNAAIDFTPTAIGTINGSAVLTDTNLNAASPNYTTQSIGLSGTGNGDPTTTAAGNASANYSAASQSVTLSATVTSSEGTANAGTVTFEVLNGTTQVGISATSGTVSNGVASASYTLPGGTSGGSYTISATYNAGGSFITSSDSTHTLTINPIAQSISFTPATPVTYGVSPITLTATGGASGNAVSFSVVSGPGSISGNTLTVTGAGTIVVAANQAGNSNYTAATQVTANIVVNQAAQSISFSPATPVTYGVSPITLTATGGASGNAVSFSVVSGSGSISGSTLTVTGAGTIVVAANQAGNTNYSAATQVTANIVVNKATATVTLGSLAPTYTGSPLAATATTNPTGLTVNFTYNGSSTAPTAAGSYTVVGTVSDPNYQGSSTGTLVIDKATATVTLGSLAPTYTGSPLAATATTNPTGLTVNFTYNGSSTAPTAAGSYTVVGTINDPNYQGSSTGTLVVGNATLTISANNANKVYGTVNPTFSGSVTGQRNGDTFTESFTTSATITSPVSTYSIVPAVTGANLSDYTQSILDGTLTVTQAGTTTALTLSSGSVTPGQSVTMSSQVTSSTTGTPTGTVSFYDNGTLLSAVTLSGGTASYLTASLAAGITHTITAVYSGDTNFTTSSSSTTSTTVTVAPLDFTMTITGPSIATVVPGSTITYQVTVAPDYGAYAGTVSFAVSGLPPGTSVSFSPSSIAVNSGPQTIAVTIQTAPATAAVHVPPRPSSGSRVAPFALAFLLLFSADSMRQRGRDLKRMVCVAMILVGGAATLMLSGCGGGNGFFTQAQQNYTVTISATSGGLQHSITVTLNVQ
ncbi:MAG: MBG domain-containing protein [Acidobacteriaceae bacterium]